MQFETHLYLKLQNDENWIIQTFFFFKESLQDDDIKAFQH